MEQFRLEFSVAGRWLGLGFVYMNMCVCVRKKEGNRV